MNRDKAKEKLGAHLEWRRLRDLNNGELMRNYDRWLLIFGE